jgi:hypothetical protein
LLTWCRNSANIFCIRILKLIKFSVLSFDLHFISAVSRLKTWSRQMKKFVHCTSTQSTYVL